MKIAVAAAAAALVLSACSQGGTENAAGNGMEGDQSMTADPATTDLNMEANATEVDQAVNQTDQEIDLGNTGEAANSAGNSAQ